MPVSRCCLRTSIMKLSAFLRAAGPARSPHAAVSHPGAERVRQLLEITRGRAFVLFTSYAQMNEIYQRLLGCWNFLC